MDDKTEARLREFLDDSVVDAMQRDYVSRAEHERLVQEADRKTLETIAALLNGDANQVAVVKGYVRNKLELMKQLTDGGE